MYKNNWQFSYISYLKLKIHKSMLRLMLTFEGQHQVFRGQCNQPKYVVEKQSAKIKRYSWIISIKTTWFCTEQHPNIIDQYTTHYKMFPSTPIHLLFAIKSLSTCSEHSWVRSRDCRCPSFRSHPSPRTAWTDSHYLRMLQGAKDSD